MYGLPFYGYTGVPQNVPPVAPPPPTHVGQRPPDGNAAAHHRRASPRTTQATASRCSTTTRSPTGRRTPAGNRAGTLSVIYRPIQPQLARDMTVAGTSAHGAFITGLTTHTIPGVKPAKPFPLVFSGDERPASAYPNIFFPAGLVTVNRDVVFGQEKSTLVVNMGRVRPDPGSETGTEQVVDSSSFDVGYSTSSDNAPPEFTQVGAVKTAPGVFNAFVRVTDDSGALHRVAVLYNTGTPAWQVKELTNAGDGLWTGRSTPPSTRSARRRGPGQRGQRRVQLEQGRRLPVRRGHGQAVDPDRPPAAGNVFTLHQVVKTTFSCSDPGGVTKCSGQPNGLSITSGGLIDTIIPGPHSFMVTATDLSGHTTTKRVTFFVRFGFAGFQPPVDNPPILNTKNAGQTIPVKWKLRDIFGQSAELERGAGDLHEADQVPEGDD